GFKKTVGGHEWMLCYGTTPAKEAFAIRFATGLDAHWQLLKIRGQAHFTRADFEEVKAIVDSAPSRIPLQASKVEFVQPVVSDAESSPASDLGPAKNLAAQTENVSSAHWMFAAIDEVVATIRKTLKPDGSNGDNVINTCERIQRARDALSND